MNNDPTSKRTDSQTPKGGRSPGAVELSEDPPISECELQGYEEFLLAPRQRLDSFPHEMVALERHGWEEAARSASTVRLRDLAARALASLSLEAAEPLTRSEYGELQDGLNPEGARYWERHTWTLKWFSKQGPLHLREAARDELDWIDERGPFLTTGDRAAELAERERRRSPKSGSAIEVADEEDESELPALRSDLDEQIVTVLVADDGVKLASASTIACRIQTRFGVSSEPDTILRALKRMRGDGWPIETKSRGSRIPPGMRRALPSAFRE